MSGEAEAARPEGAQRSDTGDLPPDEFRRLAHEVVDWMADYLANVDELPVFPSVRPGEVRAALPPSAPERGEPLNHALADFRDLIVPGINHWNHPAFFGYFSITGSGPGILGEMLASALNVNAMVWRSSPAATELEEVATDWVRQLLGLPHGFDGVINDTASSSTLYALAAAREVAYRASHREGVFGQPSGRVYASEHAHSSVEKAVLTLGFGQNGYRTIETDAAFAMRPDALEAAIESDLAAGLRPVAIVPTIGTTSSTAVDPVADIVEIATRHGLWVHVDAAYGGPAAIVPELRHWFAGWEGADSIVVNPHKWLFTPVDCSILYCRRPEELRRAFSIVPEYLTSVEQGSARDLMDYGVSLGRRFRSLKLWLVLRYFGRGGIVARLRHHVALAAELAEQVRESEDWTLVAPAHFSTVALRWSPPLRDPGAVDRANLEIRDRVNASGQAFLTHTVLGGRVSLRVAIGNLKTTREHVQRVWALLREAAAEVAEGAQAR